LHTAHCTHDHIAHSAIVTYHFVHDHTYIYFLFYVCNMIVCGMCCVHYNYMQTKL